MKLRNFCLFIILVTHTTLLALPAPRFHIGTNVGILGSIITTVGDKTTVLKDAYPTYSLALDLRVEAPIARYFHILGMLSGAYQEHKDPRLLDTAGRALEYNINAGFKVPVPIVLDFGLLEPYFLLPIGVALNVAFGDNAAISPGFNIKPVLGVQFLFNDRFGFFVEGGVNWTIFANTRPISSDKEIQIFFNVLRPTANVGFTMTL